MNNLLRTPFYQISMEGEDITPWVSSVSVVEDERQADNVTLTVPDPRRIYADSLFEGSTVEVDIGYSTPGEHALVLRAIITKVEMTYPENGVPGLTLKGEDRSILMGLVEKKKVWRGKKVTEIVLEVAKDYGYDAAHVHVELPPDKNPTVNSKPITQDGKTDLAFLQELAQTYHALCFVELDDKGQEVLYFIPERRAVELNRPDALILSYRQGPHSNLVSFSPAFDKSYIDRLKEVSDIDKTGKPVKSKPKGKDEEKVPTEEIVWQLDETLVAQANARDKSLIRSLYASGSKKKQELHQKLIARKAIVGEVAAEQIDIDSTHDVLEAQRLGMTASGSTIGNVMFRAKANVFVHGVSSRCDGPWYVSSVTHKIDGGGFKTDFKCVR